LFLKAEIVGGAVAVVVAEVEAVIEVVSIKIVINKFC